MHAFVLMLLAVGCSEDPPPPPPEPVFPATCLGLCQKTAYCAPAGSDEQDCATSCRPGGRYANMPPAAHACTAQPCGPAFFGCTAQAVAAMIGQLGPMGQAAQATIPPTGYPAGFPYVPGGQLQPSPPGPPGLQAVTVTYPQEPDALRTSLEAELGRAGWTVDGEPASPGGTQRMNASRDGRSIRVSILPGPGGQGSGLLLVSF